MKTTVTLDQRTVDEVLLLTEARTKTRAVSIALQEYARQKKMEKLRSLLGKIEVDETAIRHLKEKDLKDLRG
jgi:ABC-type uncharacterized transport system ATPase component